MTRSEVLNKAMECVCKNREQEYGSPEDNFGLIARLWTEYLGMEIETKDVAVMMILLKSARIASGSGHADNWVDIAGYAACGAELESREGAEP